MTFSEFAGNRDLHIPLGNVLSDILDSWSN